PAVRNRIVSPTDVEIINEISSAPDNHFAASPHCRVIYSGFRRVGSAGGCPAIRAGIIPSAGVYLEIFIRSAPDDHFATSPHCRVRNSGVWGPGEVCWSPCVANTSDRGTRYCRKSIVMTSSDTLIKRSALLFHSLDRRVRQQTLS